MKITKKGIVDMENMSFEDSYKGFKCIVCGHFGGGG